MSDVVRRRPRRAVAPYPLMSAARAPVRNAMSSPVPPELAPVPTGRSGASWSAGTVAYVSLESPALAPAPDAARPFTPTAVAQAGAVRDSHADDGHSLGEAMEHPPPRDHGAGTRPGTRLPCHADPREASGERRRGLASRPSPRPPRDPAAPRPHAYARLRRRPFVGGPAPATRPGHDHGRRPRHREKPENLERPDNRERPETPGSRENLENTMRDRSAVPLRPEGPGPHAVAGAR